MNGYSDNKMAMTEDLEKEQCGVLLIGEVLDAVRREMKIDDRPSIKNTVERLIREAIEAREERRAAEAQLSDPTK